MLGFYPISGAPISGSGTGPSPTQFVATGAGVASFHGNALKPAVLAGAGSATVSLVGNALKRAVLATSGHGAASFTAPIRGALSAVGSASVGWGVQVRIGEPLVAAGHGAAAWVGVSTAAGHLNAAGSASVLLKGTGVIRAVVTSLGAGSLSGHSNAIIKTALTSAGASTPNLKGRATVAGVFSASGEGLFTLGENAFARGALSARGAAVVSDHGLGLGRGVLTSHGTVAASFTGRAFATSMLLSVGKGSMSVAPAFAPNPSGQSVRESIEHTSSMAAVLATGLEELSQQQTVCFTKYIRLVLPLDGFVFWMRADLVSPSALFNTSVYNAAAFNQPRSIISNAPELCVPGSLHITTTNQQDENESFSVNQVVFTSEVEVQDMNEVSPMVMYLAEHEDFKYAFSERRSFYKQSGLYHYVGHAVYPVMETQIIDDLSQLDTSNLIISNSLPIWLNLNRFMPVFPSYLVPDNIRPPYAAVHIPPEMTRALQASPLIDQNSNHWQLVEDTVQFTLYGVRNFNAMDFMDYLLQTSLDSDTFGLMSTPVIRDEKRTQTEISALGQKKSLELKVSYYQVRVRNVARQLILKALVTNFLTQARVDLILA